MTACEVENHADKLVGQQHFADNWVGVKICADNSVCIN